MRKNDPRAKRPAAPSGKPTTAGAAGTKPACDCEKCASRPNFDKTDVFTKEVLPLAEKLHKLCEQHGLPSVMSIAYATTDDGFHGSFMRTVHNGWLPPQYKHASHILDGDESPKGFSGLSLLGGVGSGPSPMGLLAALSALSLLKQSLGEDADSGEPKKEKGQGE